MTLALVVALAAAAHLDAVAGMSPYVVDGEVIGGGTTWGVVLQDDDLVLRRVCEEAIGERPRFLHRAQDGRVLVGSSQGLLVTTDGGCTYAPVAGPLGAASTAALAVAPDDPARIAVVTSAPGGGNGLFVSADEGATFTALRSDDGDLLFGSVALGAGGLVVAGGVSPSSGAPFLWASSDDVAFAVADGATSAADGGVPPDAGVDGGADGGVEVRTTPWPAGSTLVRALGVAGDGRVALGVVDAQGGGRLVLVAPDLQAAEDAATFDGAPTAWAEHAGRRFVAIAGTALYVDDGDGFVLDEDAPAKCLVHPTGDARLWACGQLGDGAHFLATDDGVAWQPYMPFGLVVDRLCPAGTIGQTACAYLFVDGGAPVRTDAGHDDADAGAVQPPPPSCGCGAPASTLALLALLRPLSRRCRSAARGSSPRRR